MRFGLDGNLYVASRNTDKVLRFDGTTGKLIDAFAPDGNGLGGLRYPIGLVFGPDGRLYIASAHTESILRYDGQTGAFIDEFVTSDFIPTRLTFGPDGNLYVNYNALDSSGVRRFNGQTGAFIDEFVAFESLNEASGLVFGPDGNLYVNQSVASNVLRYNGSTGAFIDEFVAPFSGGLFVPRALDFGPDDNLYITNSLGNVLRFDGQNGVFIDEFVTSGSGGLDFPADLIFTASLQPPLMASGPHDILKNRYISIDPRGEAGNNPANLHIRVMVDSSQVNGLAGSGPWWASAPDADCVSVVTTTKPASEPDWSACPTVHLTGCPIVPTTTYAIAAESGGVLSADALFDTQAKPGVKWHGDVVGRFDGPSEEWTAPNANVNIDDAVAGIKTFQQDPVNATHVSVTDVHPVFLGGPHPNLLVNINDVATIILGFQGFEYAAPDLTQCP